MRSSESLKLKNERVFFRKLYYDIIKLSPKIRFVTIIDFDGRLIFGGQREGISNYLNPKSEKESLLHTIDAWLIREKLSNEIGSGKYTLTEYTKIKRITIPTDKNHLIYLTTEITVDHDKLIAKILEFLQY